MLQDVLSDENNLQLAYHIIKKILNNPKKSSLWYDMNSFVYLTLLLL